MKIYWSNNENVGNVFLQSLQLLTDDVFFHLITGSYIYINYIYTESTKVQKYQKVPSWHVIVFIIYVLI